LVVHADIKELPDKLKVSVAAPLSLVWRDWYQAGEEALYYGWQEEKDGIIEETEHGRVVISAAGSFHDLLDELLSDGTGSDFIP